jgi:hypothetical protein
MIQAASLHRACSTQTLNGRGCTPVWDKKAQLQTYGGTKRERQHGGRLMLSCAARCIGLALKVLRSQEFGQRF